MKKQYPIEMEALSTFVHGALAGLHFLGAFYNYRRKNKADTIIHSAAFLYDIYSAWGHYKELRNLEDRVR